MLGTTSCFDKRCSADFRDEAEETKLLIWSTTPPPRPNRSTPSPPPRTPARPNLTLPPKTSGRNLRRWLVDPVPEEELEVDRAPEENASELRPPSTTEPAVQSSARTKTNSCAAPPSPPEPEARTTPASAQPDRALETEHTQVADLKPPPWTRPRRQRSTRSTPSRGRLRTLAARPEPSATPRSSPRQQKRSYRITKLRYIHSPPVDLAPPHLTTPTRAAEARGPDGIDGGRPGAEVAERVTSPGWGIFWVALLIFDFE